ncbi:helix-turn-helix transcriptional regulator [Pseudoroseomonas sp. WGS1072]|uniref:helix-turn-helix transcriptional regulator n=1 Tax=Roseomonas sp. WGS1072 TaxID=3366816 RepID=UPI003BF09410
MPLHEEAPIAPLTHRVDRVVELTGASRTNVYEALRRGELEAVKLGRATLVLDASLRRWVAALPRYKA